MRAADLEPLPKVPLPTPGSLYPPVDMMHRLAEAVQRLNDLLAIVQGHEAQERDE